MPVPFVLGGPDPDTPGASAGAAEEERPDATMPYQEQYLGPGEEPLAPEDDFFFDSAEFERMESVWRRAYCLDDRLLEDTLSLRGLIRRMRELTAELEGLASDGYVLDLDAMDGDIVTLVNPRLEREQWRLRRERRRAAMAQEQHAAGAAGAAAAVTPATDAMETEEGEGSGALPAAQQQHPAAAAPAAPKSPQAPPPAFELC